MTRRLFYQLNRAQRALTRTADGGLRRELGVTAAQLGALFALGEQDGMVLKDLGRTLALANSAVSGLADRLEREGLAERRPDPRDGRAFRLHLTDRGREVMTAAKPFLRRFNGRIEDGFTPAELDIVARFFSTLTDRFKDDNDD
jgi:DNA-binding MarR family transcriptional regulator